jgi:hypothetical protein
MVNTNFQALLHKLPATRASLRRVSWGYGNDLGASLFHFALKQLPEHPQPCVVGAQGEMMIVRHKAEVQVLNRKQSVVSGEFASDLVPEVAASERWNYPRGPEIDITRDLDPQWVIDNLDELDQKLILD